MRRRRFTWPAPRHASTSAYNRIAVLILSSVATCTGFAAGDGEVNLMDPSKDMVIWTWVTFGILFIILYKLAWKPILSALDQREKDIRDAVDNAARIKEEMEQVEKQRETLIREADEKAKEIVAAARKAAVEASRVIEDRAKDEAKIMLENAAADINAARDTASARLRHESAELAVALAGKLIGENLDDEKNRTLVNKLIAEV